MNSDFDINSSNNVCEAALSSSTISVCITTNPWLLLAFSKLADQGHSSQDESMVEIKHREGMASSPEIHPPQSPEDEKYRLLYSKSKVYVHPTAYARDNIPGFVTLVKRVCVDLYSCLTYIPELIRGPVAGCIQCSSPLSVDPRITVKSERSRGMGQICEIRGDP